MEAVVFDLGGVLAEFGGMESMRRLSGIVDDEELWRRWLTCRWVRRFEGGGVGISVLLRAPSWRWFFQLRRGSQTGGSLSHNDTGTGAWPVARRTGE